MPVALLPNVGTRLRAFHEAVYESPHGEDAFYKAFFRYPELPETAGWDSTPLHQEAISSIASIRNSADEMALAAQQAQSIARATRIASLRAYEALMSYRELFRREHAQEAQGGAQDALKGALLQELKATVPTKFYAEPSSFFGQNDLPTTLLHPCPLRAKKATLHTHADFSSFMVAAKGKACKTSFAKRQAGGGKRGRGRSGALGAIAGGLAEIGAESAEGQEGIARLRSSLETAFANLRQASVEATQTADDMTQRYLRVRHASRALTEALKLPGDPTPPPVPLVMMKPPKRPRDLSPFWLDVPYGIQSGADPYKSGTDGKPRASAAESLVGADGGFNPFEGTVPMSENGLKGFYGKVKPKSIGGKVEPGIFIPSTSLNTEDLKKGLLAKASDMASEKAVQAL